MEVELEVRHWSERLGTGRRLEELAAGREHRLGESVGWMLGLFEAGN